MFKHLNLQVYEREKMVDNSKNPIDFVRHLDKFFRNPNISKKK